MFMSNFTKINKSNPFLPHHNWFSKQILWNKSLFSEKVTSINYPDYMSSDEILFKTLDNLWKYGLVFIKNVPTIPDYNNKGEREEEQQQQQQQPMIEKVVKRIGTIRNTFYGRSWDVISLPGAKNIAYSNLELGLHMDLLYVMDVIVCLFILFYHSLIIIINYYIIFIFKDITNRHQVYNFYIA